MADQTAEPRELLDLDVGEVSLVDAPAIRRKFVMVKREGGTGSNADTAADTGAEDTGNDTDTGAEDTDNDSGAEDTGADGGNVPDKIPADVVKQELPLLTALADEKLTALAEGITAIRDAVTAGTLTREEAGERFRTISSLLWSAEDDVFALAKSLTGKPFDVVALAKAANVSEDTVAAMKARRMTQRRLDELKAARDMITSLLTELEDAMNDDTTDTTDETTDKSAKGGAAGAGLSEDVTKAITTTVTAAVKAGLDEGLKPVNDRLDALEAKVNKAAGADAADDTDDDADTDAITKAVRKAVKSEIAPLAQRLDALEAEPGTTGADGNDDTTTDDVQKNKPGTSGFWSGAGLSPR